MLSPQLRQMIYECIFHMAGVILPKGQRGFALGDATAVQGAHLLLHFLASLIKTTLKQRQRERVEDLDGFFSLFALAGVSGRPLGCWVTVSATASPDGGKQNSLSTGRLF